MKRIIPLIAFSVLLLVPIGTQNSLAHSDTMKSPSRCDVFGFQDLSSDTATHSPSVIVNEQNRIIIDPGLSGTTDVNRVFIDDGIGTGLSDRFLPSPPLDFGFLFLEGVRTFEFCYTITQSDGFGGTFSILKHTDSVTVDLSLRDDDNDGIFNHEDNCINDANPNQEDGDGDGIGDACDLLFDTDGDLVADTNDNCVLNANPNQEDADNDGIGDACDDNPTMFCGSNAILVGFECQGVSAGGFDCGPKTEPIAGLCVPKLDEICTGGAVIEPVQMMTCIAQSMGSMIGGELLAIDTMALFVGAIGINPVITGLVAITMSGIAAQAIWFVHQRRKSN